VHHQDQKLLSISKSLTNVVMVGVAGWGRLPSPQEEDWWRANEIKPGAFGAKW
jgi:hypothetical protein